MAARSRPTGAAEKPRRPSVATGEVASGFSVVGGIPEVDYLDELDFPSYLEEFRRLENDPAIAKALKSNTLPVLNADWSVEPASDDVRDLAIAELCGSNLYQQEGDYFGREFWCRTPWLQRLRDALRFLAHGFAMFQKIYRVQGRFTVFEKFKYIQPASIQVWRFARDTDEFLGVDRTYVGADGRSRNLEPVEADELFVYTWDQQGSNILGRPLIRPMWMDFNIKNKAKKLGIIDKQKTAVGVPFFKNAADDQEEDQRKGEDVAKQMRSGNYERLWVRLREGQDFGWKEGGQSTKGLPEIVRLSNEEIARVGGDPSNELGISGSGGSRGVAGTQAAFSSLLQSAVVRVVEEYERALCRELVDLNFRPPPSAYPSPKSSDVDPFEKTRTLPDIMANLGTGKAITKTRDTENEIRRRYKLMEIEQEQYDELNPAAPPTPPATNDGEGPPAGPAADSGAGPAGIEGPPPAPPSATSRSRVRLQTDRERVLSKARIDPEAIRRELERLESVYLATLRRVQSDMREAVVEQVKIGRLAPARAEQVKVPFQDELRDRLVAILKSTRDYGRDRIYEELKHQLNALARRPIPNPTTRRGAMSFSNEQAQVKASLDVTNLVSRLQSQTVAEYNRLVGTGVTHDQIGDRLAALLSTISDKQVADMARDSTSAAFNQGRTVGILEHRDQIGDYAVRVEVDPGDPNTCDPCQRLNGETFRIGSPEFLANQPPAGCLGKLRCRGFYAVEVAT